MNRDIFENLFVLEMTNNHQGSLQRALDIVHEHSRVVRFNNVRAAIKLQFRDVDSFVHKDFRDRSDIRYIKRVMDTKISKDDYATLVRAIKKSGCIPMATPFDEKSVDWCVDFDLPIIKIASADSNDWILIERIAATRKPCIISFGATPSRIWTTWLPSLKIVISHWRLTIVLPLTRMRIQSANWSKSIF